MPFIDKFWYPDRSYEKNDFGFIQAYPKLLDNSRNTIQEN